MINNFFRQNQGGKILIKEIFFCHFFGFSVIFLPTAAPMTAGGAGVTQMLYRSPAFRICMCCQPKYEWNLLKIGFKNTYFLVFLGFPAIPVSSQISQIWVNFGQKGLFLKFSPKSENVIIFRLQRLCFEQKLGNSDLRFQKKMPKTSILVIFGQKGPFWTVFGQNGQNGENYQKSAWNIYL